MEQRSTDWFDARLGKVTASRVSDAVATLKGGGEAATRKNYKAQLVAERLTGVPQGADLSNNKAVQWGVEQEPAARAAYEFFTGYDVVEVGFVEHPTIAMAGASPDGLVGDDGLLEIKNPQTATHIEYLLANKVPAQYRNQMLWQLACTGRKWVDFVSYDSRLNPANQMFLIRFEPDPQEIKDLEAQVIVFLDEVAQMIDNLENRK